VLLACRKEAATNEQYVAGFLSQRGCPGATPYPGVRSLVPGHYLICSRGGVQVRSFWRPPVDSAIRYTRESEYAERLRELFREAVRCRLLTDYPVITQLSGGMDSSSIVCMESVLARTGRLSRRGRARARPHSVLCPRGKEALASSLFPMG
jgi:asparagine synthase (glutamine-hydrolysing)